MIRNLRKNIPLLNTISNILLQICTIISAFVIPKIILSCFGSDVNGLVSSLNQMLNYIALLEGGVTGVIMANLYKPLYEKDYKKVSSLIITTRDFYRKIGLIFIGYAIILGIVYPFIFRTQFSLEFVFLLTMILAVNLFMQYNFSLTYRTLLNADKKIYIVSFSQSILLLINIGLSIISIKIYPSIHLLKLVSTIIYISQPIIYTYFVRKYYPLEKKVEKDKNLLKSRWNGFAINIAAFIHFNTDIAVLTIFTDLKTVSIYSIYKLVANGLNQLINAVASAIAPSIGHIYASGKKEILNEKFNEYEWIIFMLTFSVYTIAIMLITPFVMIYTKNILDADYYQPAFGILLLISEAFYILKSPHVNLAYAANKFKEMTIPAYLEAVMNIIISLILVNRLGLIGVAIGTLIAMLYRTIFQVLFLQKNILIRKFSIFAKKMIVFSIGSVLGLLVCTKVIPPTVYTINSWLIHAIIYSIIIMIIMIIESIVFYKRELTSVIKHIIK